MSGREELLEAMDRFFDGEMSPAEKADLMEALQGDYEMRLRFRQIAVALDCLEKLPVARLAEGFARQAATAAFAEHRRSIIKVWMVGAAMAASLLLAVTVYLVRCAGIESIRVAPAGPSPVTFMVSAPEARSIHLVGDFNRWELGDTALQRDSGAWRATVDLLPGRYAYQIVVDEQDWICDPSSPIKVNDGFGGTNSLLVVGN